MRKLVLYIALLLGLQANAQQLISSPGLVVNTTTPLPSVSNLVTDFDFSKLSSLTISGGKVMNITDQAARVVSAQSTTANQPGYVRNGGAGNNGYAHFAGSQSLSGALLTGSTDFTLIILRRVAASASASDNLGSFQNGSGSTGYGTADMIGSSTGTSSGGYYEGESSMEAPIYFASKNRWELVILSHSAGSTKIYNTLGAAIPPLRTDLDPITPTTGHTIGGVSGLSNFNGDITRILLYNRQLSDSEVLTLCEYFWGRYELLIPGQYISGGDSITASAASSTQYNYPNYTIQALLPTEYLFLTQTAVPGRQSGDVLDSLQKEVLDKYQPTVKNVYTLLVFHNDAGTGLPLDSSIKHIDTILARTHRAGFKNVLITAFNTTDYSQTLTDAFNVTLRSDYRAMGADTLLDANVIPNLTDPTNTTYFYDGTHLTLLGAQLMSAQVQPFITYFLTH